MQEDKNEQSSQTSLGNALSKLGGYLWSTSDTQSTTTASSTQQAKTTPSSAAPNTIRATYNVKGPLGTSVSGEIEKPTLIEKPIIEKPSCRLM